MDDEADPIWVAIRKAHKREEFLLRWIKESEGVLLLARQELDGVRARKKDLLNEKLRLGRYAQRPA